MTPHHRKKVKIRFNETESLGRKKKSGVLKGINATLIAAQAFNKPACVIRIKWEWLYFPDKIQF